jgi:hypothetical protein
VPSKTTPLQDENMKACCVELFVDLLGNYFANSKKNKTTTMTFYFGKEFDGRKIFELASAKAVFAS